MRGRLHPQRSRELMCVAASMHQPLERYRLRP